MLTKPEMSARLKELGLSKKYKPVWVGDPGDGPEENSIGLESRRFKFGKEGRLDGASFTIMRGYVDVWTSQKNKAMAAARDNRFEITELDGEAILRVPFDKADKFLHAFGAKVKRNVRPMTPEEKAAAVARLKAARAKTVTFKLPAKPAEPARDVTLKMKKVRKKRS